MIITDTYIITNTDNIIPNIPLTITSDDWPENASVFYQIKSDHRDGRPDKAQWQVNPEDEIATFVFGFPNSISGDYSWGLCFKENKPVILGITKNGHNSRIAKFENKRQEIKNNPWHGYPADYITDYTHDLPNIAILASWGLTESEIKRLKKGKGWRK